MSTLMKLLNGWFLRLSIGLAGVGFAHAAEPATKQSPIDLNEAIALVPLEYRHRLVQQLSLAEEKRDQWLGAIEKAPASEREQLAFLLVNMPEHDLQSLNAEFLLHDIELAEAARQQTAWAKAIPREIFLNDVLPYANLNERRDDWRGDFASRFASLVKDCKTAGEAAQVLNRQVFKTLKVSYNAAKRRKPDQSPYESTDCGYASCSGLSIILVDACRAVGVPARVAGTPLWFDGSGNHTWVEIWDGQWRFVGAAEPGEFNKTWFADIAAKADDAKPAQRIYAASFRRTGLPFLMVWDPTSTDYSAVDVTGFYVHRQQLKVTVTDTGGPTEIQVRQGGILVAQTAASSATFELAADTDYALRAVLPNGSTVDQSVHLEKSTDTSVTLSGAGGRKTPSASPG